MHQFQQNFVQLSRSASINRELHTRAKSATYSCFVTWSQH